MVTKSLEIVMKMKGIAIMISTTTNNYKDVIKKVRIVSILGNLLYPMQFFKNILVNMGTKSILSWISKLDGIALVI